VKKRCRLAVELLESRLVLSGLGLGHPEPGQAPSDPHWDQVIVVLHEQAGAPQAVASDVIGRFGGQLGHVYEHALNGFSAQLPPAAVAALANNPRIKSIETDLHVQTSAQTVPTGVRRIGTAENSTVNLGAGTQIDIDIAVLDTGIQATHPDLNVAGGRRFYTVISGPPKGRGSFEDDRYDDDHGHGTHVAGIAAALDNGVGVAGVAPGARLWAVKVLDAAGNGLVSDIIKGIDWVTANAATIEIANMSLGGQGVSTAYREAIQRSVAAGVVYVAAAGNSYRDILGADGILGTSDDTVPAAYPEVATISAMADSDGLAGGAGALTSYGYADDTFADFSNFSNSDAGGNSWYLQNNPVVSPGLGIDLIMPGVDILSTYKGGGYAMMSGTSMAAPHAAGLVALYMAEHGRAANAAEVYAIRQALIDAGKPWRSDEGLVSPPVGQPNSDSPDKHEENLGWAGDQVTGPALTISIVPPEGDFLEGTVTIAALARYDGEDGVGVELFVNGESLGLGTNSGDTWSVLWDTATIADGEYLLQAVATAGELTATDEITVVVDNIIDLPGIQIVSPGEGDTVSGQFIASVIVTADRRLAVTQVAFTLDGDTQRVSQVDTDGSDSWSVLWDTEGLLDGAYILTAEVTDSAGQTAENNLAITVNNAVRQMDAALDGTAVWINKNLWEARVTVTVVDQGGGVLAGASVTGIWSNGKQAAGVTDASGRITFVSDRLRGAGSVEFTLAAVTLDGYEYQAGQQSITVHSNNTTTRSSATAYRAAALWDLFQKEDSRKGRSGSADGTVFGQAVDQLMAGL